MAPSLVPSHADEIYGRDAELAQFETLIRAPTDAMRLLLIIGAGGTGKTYLLKAFEKRLQNHRFLPLYDFYHVDNFTARSIETAILGAVDKEENFCAEYDEKRKKLDSLRQGDASFEKAQNELRQAFIDCYNQVAELERQQGRPLVLLFDTAEQAVDLSDNAATIMLEATHKEANWGGEYWLTQTLPRLKNTLVVLSGRKRGLDRRDVQFYTQLQRDISDVVEMRLHGLQYDETCRLAHELRAKSAAPESPDEVRGLAEHIPLDERTLGAWHQISNGLPYWVALLLTASMLEVLGDALDSLIDRLQKAPTDTLNDAEREQYRELIIRRLLLDAAPAKPLLVVLQWMASLQKGLSIDLLQHLLDEQNFGQQIEGDVMTLFDNLHSLVIIKQREPSSISEVSGVVSEPLLFLHDEIYHWLTIHTSDKPPLSDQIVETAIDWYVQQIKHAEQQQIEAEREQRALEASPEALLYGMSSQTDEVQDQEREQQQAALRDKREHSLRRRRQFERDRLNYFFHLDFDRGLEEYNILAYTAIRRRDYGYSISVRQEGLRNIYHAREHVPMEIEVECAARWLLRAVHADPIYIARLLPKLPHYYDQENRYPGVHFALLRAVHAQALIYEGTQNRALIGKLLDEAAALMQAAGAETVHPRWHDFLWAQIVDSRGYLHRLRYELAQAIENYRLSLQLRERHHSLPQLFVGITLNNMAFAYSEQGETEDARAYALAALERLLSEGSDYHTALCYNTLARIEIRAGRPRTALEFVSKAYQIMERLNSIRGLMLCLPVLGEAYRKLGDDLSHDRVRQQRSFQRALDIFAEAEAFFDQRNIHDHDRRRELYQQWGCTYRSRARVMSTYDKNNPQIAQDYADARRCLAKTIEHIDEGNLPALMWVDTYEDLAVIYVHQDTYDEELEHLLHSAESAAPEEYRIQARVGLRDVSAPTKAYWRELGQVELQRMMQGFGLYEFDQSAGQSDYLDKAAKHMVCMFAYLLKYASASWMLVTAERLTLRELRDNHTRDDLKRLALAAFESAERYNLLETEAFRRVTDLIRKVELDLDLFYRVS